MREGGSECESEKVCAHVFIIQCHVYMIPHLCKAYKCHNGFGKELDSAH